jgi:hypothetical protein
MRRTTGFVLALAILSSAACYQTKAVSVADAPADTRAWLTLGDQSVVLVYGPQIYGKRLVGYVDGKYREFLIADVKAVHVRQPQGARTAALATLGALTAAGLAYLLTDPGSQGPGRPDICDSGEDPDNEICSE